MKRISTLFFGSVLLGLTLILSACPSKKPEGQKTEENVNADDLQKEADAILKEIDALQ